MKYDMGYEPKELEKARKLAWVAGERKTGEGEELYAEEDKGRFWGEQPLQSLDRNNSFPQNQFCLLRHSSKKKEVWNTLATHFLSFSCGQYTKRVATQQWIAVIKWQRLAYMLKGSVSLTATGLQKKNCLLHKLIANCQSMKDSLSVKARKHYPRDTDATPVCTIISLG